MSDVTLVLRSLVETVNQLRAELAKDNWELRAEIASLKWQNEVRDVSWKYHRIITSLPAVTSLIQNFPRKFDEGSGEVSELESPPKQRIRGENLRSRDMIKPPDRFQ